MWGDHRSAEWHDDYVVDVEYSDPLMPWLNPARLSLACVLNGQPPLPRDRPLVWAELGCGNGLQACAVAAGDPTAQVWACDFNPAHVERARRRAESAGLTNCTFDEASFEQLVDDPAIGPAQVDVVVAHGVFTWVSKRNQTLIGEFVRRRLRPGGVVYVSYSVSTGWSSVETLAEAMRLHARSSGLRSDAAVVAAAGDLRQLADAGAAFFPLPRREQEMVDSWPERDPRYLAHDFLVGRYQPVMFDEVAAVMEAAQCVYVGDALAADQNPEWRAPSGIRPALDAAYDIVEREMLRDLTTQRGFRCDVWRRGDLRPSDVGLDRWLGEVRLVGLAHVGQPDAVVSLPFGEATLDPAFLAPVSAALAAGPIAASALQAIHPELSGDDLRHLVSLLVRGDHAMPEAHGWEDRGSIDACHRFNRMVASENIAGDDHSWLLVPATGSLVHVDPVGAMALGAWWSGEAADAASITEVVLSQLRRLSRHVREDGVVLTDEVREREVARQRVESAIALVRNASDQLGMR